MLRPRFKKLVISLFRNETMTVSSRFDELLENILAEHEKKLDDHHQSTDLMDGLLTAYRNENAEYKITRKHIKSFIAVQCFTLQKLSLRSENSCALRVKIHVFANAGYFICKVLNNQAKTIQWTMAEIINNPNVLEKLIEEIDSRVGKKRLIQETDLPNLSYLQAVVKEAIRIHPSGPIFLRFSKEACRIRGFHMPEETSVVVNAYAVMRNPRDDPLVFKPERFLASASSRSEEKDEERRVRVIKYLPFGSERRNCPR